MEKANAKLRVIDQIGARMKEYENEAPQRLSGDKPLIVRLDGHKFSSFTRGFRKPFDERLHSAMRKTVEDIVRNYPVVLGYTQSDEITLLFATLEENQMLIFGGKALKIATLLASYAGVRFNFHLNQLDFSSEPKLKEKVASCVAHFDGRVFHVPSKKEALNNVLWRHQFDCRRNSVFALALAHFSQKSLLNLGTTALINKLKDEKGVDWDQQPAEFKYGSFTKKELFKKPIPTEHLENFKHSKEEEQDKQGEETVLRSRVVTKSFDLAGFNQENIDLIFAKYWPSSEETIPTTTTTTTTQESTEN